ncbi:MAG: MBL fold metallo-hydrolase, partial [Methylocystaceae bacterium]
YGMLLLDCGCAGDVARIEAKCVELGRPLSDIKLAVATHAHPDHLGGAAKLRRKYAIPIAAHPEIDLWYRGAGGFIQHKVDSFFANWVAMKSGRHIQSVRYKRSIRPDYHIEGGMRLPKFVGWEVFYIPGHTSHDIALYQAESKMLYWGDSICSANGKLHLPVPVLYPGLMRQSLQKMVALEPQQLLLAHGGVFQVKNQDLLTEQVNAVLNQEVNPHINRLQRYFLFSKAARQGLIKYDGFL